MSHTVTLMPSGVVFDIPSDLPILLAAQNAGLRLPSSCRNGTCRTCMCRVVSGHVAYAIEWPGLSMEEKRDGYTLPCVAYALSDLIVDEPRAKPIE